MLSNGKLITNLFKRSEKITTVGGKNITVNPSAVNTAVLLRIDSESCSLSSAFAIGILQSVVVFNPDEDGNTIVMFINARYDDIKKYHDPDSPEEYMFSDDSVNWHYDASEGKGLTYNGVVQLVESGLLKNDDSYNYNIAIFSKDINADMQPFNRECYDVTGYDLQSDGTVVLQADIRKLLSMIEKPEEEPAEEDPSVKRDEERRRAEMIEDLTDAIDVMEEPPVKDAVYSEAYVEPSDEVIEDGEWREDEPAEEPVVESVDVGEVETVEEE